MPAEITAPPAAAPTALPRLTAPTFTDDAKPGAAVAARITPICSGGTTAKVATPKISSEIAAPTGVEPIPGNASRSMMTITRNVISVPSSERSAMRPPRPLPSVKPRPISTSMPVMKAGDAPVMSARVGAI
ncbi:hypothetical protein G6F24_017172 [Rhizopus arrhizus]|nr:hypothetical protein G6F24_017172 [Rhizopus arrhizus]